MKAVGQILKTERQNQKKPLKEITQKTKIPLGTLKAIESDDFSSLPAAAFIQGFIKNYAQELGLNPQKLLAIFRRDFDKKQKNKIIPPQVLEANSGFHWTPKMTLLTSIILLLTLFSSYLFWQYKHFWGKPRLEIITPSEKIEVQEKRVKIEGQTDSEASLKINNEVVTLDEDGSFQKEVELFEGENKILIEAVSRIGKKTKIEREVYYRQSNE